MRKARRAELQKTSPFLVEHVAIPYDQRLAEFNKAPRLTQKYSGYTDAIIGLLVDPTRISLHKHATDAEKKSIMQAVMANELIGFDSSERIFKILDSWCCSIPNF